MPFNIRNLSEKVVWFVLFDFCSHNLDSHKISFILLCCSSYLKPAHITKSFADKNLVAHTLANHAV